MTREGVVYYVFGLLGVAAVAGAMWWTWSTLYAQKMGVWDSTLSHRREEVGVFDVTFPLS